MGEWVGKWVSGWSLGLMQGKKQIYLPHGVGALLKMQSSTFVRI